LNRIISICLFLLIAVITIAVFYPSISADFYLDDFGSIAQNALIKPPVDYSKLIDFYGLRSLAYTIFSFEYSLFADDPFGYHLASLAIHLVNVALLFLLLNALLKSRDRYIIENESLQSNTTNSTEAYRVSAALLGASLFAIHPQNTQTAIYIVQQIASIATLFSLISIYSYIQLRSSEYRIARYGWATLTLLSFLLAMLSKQNTIVVPVIWLLIEWLVFKQYHKQMVFIYGALVLLLLLALSIMKGSVEDAILLIDGFTRENKELSRWHYFITQLKVIGHYITQYFYPVDLRLEYDFEIKKSLSNVELGWVTFHSLAIISVLLVRKRLPLVALGVISYYVFHIVESSIIPIRDVAFEHRTYLPNIGFSLCLAALSYMVMSKYKPKTYMVTLCAILVLAPLALASHQRAELWADKFAFYEHEISLSKRNPRAYLSLGNMHIQKGNCPMAVSYFDHALALYKQAHKSNLGSQPELFQSYANCLFKLGLQQDAFNILDQLAKQVKTQKHKASVLAQKARMLMDLKLHRKAKALLVKAYRFDNKNLAVLVNLAICEAVLKNFKAAKFLLESALIVNPDHKMTKDLLAKVNRVLSSQVKAQPKS